MCTVPGYPQTWLDKIVGTSLLELPQAETQENLRYQSQNDHEVSPILQAFHLDLSLQDIFMLILQ
jgi:hypothetical protein